MKRCLVLGYGISGKAAAALLKKQGWDVAVADKNGDGREVLIDAPELPLEGFELLVLSPGFPQSHPLVAQAKSRGIETIGEIELAFRSMHNRCIGITGSNGKTTTTLLTAHLLNAGGKKAKALGNVGASLSGYLLDSSPDDILVVELSSFQLETLHTKCLDAALIVNITPNHLDRHASMQEYAETKLHIADCLKENGKLFVSADVYREYGIGEIFDLELNSKEGYVFEKQNTLAARALCSHFGVDVSARDLETFQKPPHRMEWVGRFGAVSYYNDSKSSNIHSVMYGIAQLSGQIHLLIGGVHKGASYKPWIDAFKGKVKKMYAFGGAAQKMEEDLAESFPFAKVQTMREALDLAQTEAQEGETILLSPGCSSYDQFRNFEERGEMFKRMVKEKS